MAGTRQYGGLDTIPFDIFPTPGTGTVTDNDAAATTGTRRQGTTLDQFPAANVIDYTTTQVNGFTGISEIASIGSENLFTMLGPTPHLFTKGAGLDYQIHVIRGMNFRVDPGTVAGAFGITGGNETDVTGRGIHVVFVNCTFTALNPNGNSGNNVWLTTNRNNLTNFGSGKTAIQRAVSLVDRSLETGRSMNFIGCTISMGAGDITRSFRVAACDIRETIFLDPFSNADNRDALWYLYSQPGGLIENSIITSPGSYFTDNGPQRLWLTGPTTFTNTDTRGFNVATADGAQVEVFSLRSLPGLSVAAFHSGSAAAAADNSQTYTKSIDPITTIAGTGTAVADGLITYTGSTPFRTDARYIELLRYRPEFHSAVDQTTPDVSAIHVQANYGITFTTPDDYTDASATANPTTYNYFSSANGLIEGNGWRPDLGEMGTVDGLAVPVARYNATLPLTTSPSRQTQRVEFGTSNIAARAFWNNLPDADGETTYTINRAALIARAGSADTEGRSLGLRIEAPADPALGNNISAFFALNGGAARTVANLNAYFNSNFSGTQNFTDQAVSDAMKALHYQYETIPFRTVAGSVASVTGMNLNYVSSATNAITWTDATNTLEVRGPAGASTGGASPDPVQSLNIGGAVDFGNQTVQNANITATSLTGLREGASETAARGGTFAGAYTPTTVGTTLRFVADDDGNGADLSGFTATAAVVLTGAIAVSPMDTTNITQPVSVSIEGFNDNSYVQVYDVSGASPFPVPNTVPVAGVIDTDVNPTFSVENAQVGSTLRIVITSATDEDFIFERVVTGTAADTVVVNQRPQATPIDPATDPNDPVAGLSLTTAVTGTNAAAQLTITINGASVDVDGGNPLSDSQSFGFLTRAKITAAYNQLIAERNDTSVQIFRPLGVQSPGGIWAEAVTIEAGTNPGPAFQQLGFIQPIRAPGATDTLTNGIVNGGGVFISATATFDLPLTVSEITNVVRSEAFIEDLTDPSVNAIRNFLQLSDN